MTPEELEETLRDAYPLALRQAALEAFEGRYKAAELAQRVDESTLIKQAIALVTA